MEWDMERAIAEAMVEGEPRRGRKLSFYSQCQAFAALHDRPYWRRAHIAEVFGLSMNAVAQLGACLTTSARIKRYQLVAQEFRALGVDEFNRLYYTEALHNKLTVARHKIRTASLTK